MRVSLVWTAPVLRSSAPTVFPSGDVLLSINGIDLTQLTYTEAVSVLKAQTAQSQVVLRVIQTLSEDPEELAEADNKDELDTADDGRDDSLNWTPLWTRWLGLPRWTLLCAAVPAPLRGSVILIKCLLLSATCTGAATSSCRRPTTRAGVSASWGATRRAAASSPSLSRPSCQEHRRTLTDASSKQEPSAGRTRRSAGLTSV